jgi:hypothetical protein
MLRKELVEILKRNIAAINAKSCRTPGMGVWSTAPLSVIYVENIFVAVTSCAITMNARAVNEGGPTAMNIAGRDISAGRPEMSRRPK